MQERIYCAYIVTSRSHTLYIGVTGNLLKRIFEHKQRTHPGFSAQYNCNSWFGLSGSPGRKARLCARNS